MTDDRPQTTAYQPRATTYRLKTKDSRLKMTLPNSTQNVGVYVDVANLSLSGGFHLRYDALRQFASRDGAEVLRLNAYVPYDTKRAAEDTPYQIRCAAFHQALRQFGYKVILCPVKWLEDENGRHIRADADMQLALNAVDEVANLDRVLLASGDGDFTPLVESLQRRGRRVEVVGLDNVSRRLRHAADVYLSGYMIPGLIPLSGGGKPQSQVWGEIGSRVRGYCCQYKPGYGFLRFLKSVWPEAYADAFFHESFLPATVSPRKLPSEGIIFEFTLAEGKDGLMAADLQRVSGQQSARQVEVV